MNPRVVCVLVASMALCSVFAGRALAQFSPPMNLPGKARSNLTQEQQEKLDAMDRDYDKKMKQIPDKKVPSDPWGNMRGAEPKGSADQR